MIDRKDFESRDFDSLEGRGGASVGGEGEGEVAESGAAPCTARASKSGADPSTEMTQRGQRVRALLMARLGEEVFKSWFGALEFQDFDGSLLRVSVPVQFLKKWIQTHYADVLLECAAREFVGCQRVDVILRQPGGGPGTRPPAVGAGRSESESGREPDVRKTTTRITVAAGLPPRIQVNGLDGSPLDPRYTFDSFVVGAANRMAHAGATQVAETVLAEHRGFNPLYIHSGVGHGKTHLLHAIAWEVRRRTPSAQVLYLTAERFRFQFVEALKAQDAMAFKDRFRSVDVLLVDDLEFMHGEKTELEFDHIINMLLDSGRQLVVASARPPGQLLRLNERMRSRMQRGLVTEIGPFDGNLRAEILKRRIAEKRAADPSFEIPADVVSLLAERLTESGRELEGAVTRLYATWQYMRTPITLDIVETMIRDLLQSGGDQRRIKIEDILKAVSRHYGISRGDILSQRRHRSVVWPRQIGMYLAKQLTSRSLPEIGRRFGNRDHTTVLHAIRKIEGELSGNARLKDEIEDLKKQLAN
jgi:chromosomal replication initiator protein